MSDERPLPDDGRSREQFRQRRRSRNWALFLCLIGLMIIFYLMTIVRFGGAMHRSLAP